MPRRAGATCAHTLTPAPLRNEQVVCGVLDKYACELSQTAKQDVEDAMKQHATRRLEAVRTARKKAQDEFERLQKEEDSILAAIGGDVSDLGIGAAKAAAAKAAGARESTPIKPAARPTENKKRPNAVGTANAFDFTPDESPLPAPQKRAKVEQVRLNENGDVVVFSKARGLVNCKKTKARL